MWIKVASFFLFAIVLAACSNAAETNSTVPSAEKKKDSSMVDEKNSLDCDFLSLTLPENAVVFAAGAYSGRTIDFQIDQSGENASQIDVVVNYAKTPVVLMLGAYDPTIWNISWTQRTQIVAVLASGYHRQVIAGLKEETPSLVSTYENRNPCGYFYVTPDQMRALNPYSRRLFNRPVTTVYPAENGEVVVGDPVTSGTQLMSSGATTPESYRNESAPLAGMAGLEEAVLKGLLKRATKADADSWVDAVLKEAPKKDVPPVAGQESPKPPRPPIEKAYVVLKSFTYPSGLYGDTAVFLLPKGVPKPSGDPGHSALYDFNTLKCEGALCSPN